MALATAQNGRAFYRRNPLTTLREREVANFGVEITATKGVPFRAATNGEVSAVSPLGPEALRFTLALSRPVIDRQFGRQITGVVQGGSILWQMGRRHDLDLPPSILSPTRVSHVE